MTRKSLAKPKPVAPILWSIGATLVTVAPVLNLLVHDWTWLGVSLVCTGLWWGWFVPSSIKAYRARLRRWRVRTDAYARLNAILARGGAR